MGAAAAPTKANTKTTLTRTGQLDDRDIEAILDWLDSGSARSPNSKLDCTKATFVRTRFESVVFPCEVVFDNATFENGPRDAGDPKAPERCVNFRNCVFERKVTFKGARFSSNSSPEFGKVEFTGVQFRGGADFENATFYDAVHFGESTFGEGPHGAAEPANFKNTVFRAQATFKNTIFKKGAWFDDALFGVCEPYGHLASNHSGGACPLCRHPVDLDYKTSNEPVKFVGTKFLARTSFERAHFNWRLVNHQHDANKDVPCSDEVSFDGAHFDLTWFGNATFASRVHFRESVFNGKVVFYNTTFGDTARFSDATFHDQVELPEATFRNQLRIKRCDFRATVRLGRFRVEKVLLLNQSIFHEEASMSVVCPEIHAAGTRFLGGLDLAATPLTSDDASLVEIAFDGAMFRGRSVVQGERGHNGKRSGHSVRIVSLREADVGDLVVAALDLSRCLFAGANNLEKMRIEESVIFDRAPARLFRGLPWHWPRRHVVFEEGILRKDEGMIRSDQKAESNPSQEGSPALAATSAKTASGQPNGQRTRQVTFLSRPALRHQAPASEPKPRSNADADWPHQADVPGWLAARTDEPFSNIWLVSPDSVAGTYRALRKGREDNADAFSSGDFYYGEMEMHRLDPKKGPWEMLVLGGYWAISGYGQRILRPLLALAMFVGLCSVLYWRFWVQHSPPFLSTLAAVAKLSVAFEDPSHALTLTPFGDLMQAVVRVVGPVLIALTVLSVRGRLKR